MTQLFEQGGPLFMSILTLLLLVILVISGIKFLALRKGSQSDEQAKKQLDIIKELGLFTLMFGVFAQMISLYQILAAVEGAGEVPAAMLAGGLKLSTITTVYGLLIFLCAYLIWLLLGQVFTKKTS